MLVNCAVTGFPPNINAAFQYATSDHLDAVYQLTSAGNVDELTPLETIWYRPAVLANHLRLSAPRDVCLKTHNANILLQDIPLCPHQMSKGAVYLVRDPRDVAVSYAKHMGLTIDEAIEGMASRESRITRADKRHVLFHWLGTWSENVQSWARDDSPIQTAVIRYEDLLLEPFHWFRVALDALGLSKHVDDERLAWAIEQTSFERLQNQESERGFRETGGKQGQFFNRGAAGGWRDVLTDGQAEKIEADHGDVMKHFAYEPSLIGV